MAQQNCSSNRNPSTSLFQFEAGRDPKLGLSPVSRWLTCSYTYEDLTASAINVQIPPKSIVLRVWHRVEIAFTGVTAMIVGDGDATNGWLATGLIVPGTPGAVTDPTSAYHLLFGKWYEDGDTIDIAQTGIATAGAGILFVELISYHEAYDAEN